MRFIAARAAGDTHGPWERLVPAGVLFSIALVCRVVDLDSGIGFGTHGFWHLSAAGAVYLQIRFLYEVARLDPRASEDGVAGLLDQP